MKNNVYRGSFNIGISMLEVDVWSATIEENGFGKQVCLIYHNKEVRGRLIIDVCNVSIGGMTIDIDGKKVDVRRIEDKIEVCEHRLDDAGDRYR